MIRDFWPLLIGFGLWAAAFVLLYSVQALGCVWQWPAFWHRLLMIAIAISSIGSLAAIFLWQKPQKRERSISLQAPGVLLTAAALFASTVIFAPTLFASPCV